MCAAPAKTSDEEVVDAARNIVEQHGVDALSMSAVARRVGVRAPSLYKRFPSRDALLDAVAQQALAQLASQLARAGRGRGGVVALKAMAKAYRDFAKRAPHVYALLFTRRAEATSLVTARAHAVGPAFEVLRAMLANPRDTLHAARLLTAFLHGFVSMENEGAFQLGGQVARAFDYGLDTLLTALKTNS